jgi:hypothetical protein
LGKVRYCLDEGVDLVLYAVHPPGRRLKNSAKLTILI